MSDSIRAKISDGRLKRNIVESRLAKLKERLKHHESQYEKLKGFYRDTYVSQNGIMSLNTEIDTGEKIIEIMNELGV